MKMNPCIEQHFREPFNLGEFPTEETNVRTVLVRSDPSGKAIQLQIKVDDEKITAACFKAQGCPCTIAVASYICQLLVDKSLEGAESINSTFIAHGLNLPKEKVFCALLGEDAIKQLINQ